MKELLEIAEHEKLENEESVSNALAEQEALTTLLPRKSDVSSQNWLSKTEQPSTSSRGLQKMGPSQVTLLSDIETTFTHHGEISQAI